jgi:hypothetical protein
MLLGLSCWALKLLEVWKRGILIFVGMVQKKKEVSPTFLVVRREVGIRASKDFAFEVVRRHGVRE